jgi:hypothetical protein
MTTPDILLSYNREDQSVPKRALANPKVIA